MSRSDALKAVIASLETELAALKRFDIDALAAATAEKETRIGALAARNDNPLSDESARWPSRPCASTRPRAST